jgi:hypothetical protein
MPCAATYEQRIPVESDTPFQVLVLSFDLGYQRVLNEEQVNGMFLKRRHFGPGTGQWKGRNPQRPESWTKEGA